MPGRCRYSVAMTGRVDGGSARDETHNNNCSRPPKRGVRPRAIPPSAATDRGASRRRRRTPCPSCRRGPDARFRPSTATVSPAEPTIRLLDPFGPYADRTRPISYSINYLLAGRAFDFGRARGRNNIHAYTVSFACIHTRRPSAWRVFTIFVCVCRRVYVCEGDNRMLCLRLACAWARLSAATAPAC